MYIIETVLHKMLHKIQTDKSIYYIFDIGEWECWNWKSAKKRTSSCKPLKHATITNFVYEWTKVIKNQNNNQVTINVLDGNKKKVN